MSSSAPSSSDVFETFCALASPGTPLTTPEVAAEFDCTDRTIYNKLDALAEDGRLETKKVGARGRVWWQAPSRSESNGGVEPETAHTGSDDTERVDEDSKKPTLPPPKQCFAEYLNTFRGCISSSSPSTTRSSR